MSLVAGQTLGSYEIVSALGAGGMGEVYRARDTKLKRDVALKVLPSTLSTDGERLARFQREAEVLASLNHPHIAAIYGIEEAASNDGTVRAIVMELVDGETLAHRIAGGRLATTEAISIAQQIAEALQAAHDQGIVHRDLKPGNIMLTADDQVKVLDFGLSKVYAPTKVGALDEHEGPGASLANSPTFTSPLVTGMGTLLGTAAYMSPEQAKGRPADKRSDIWAFGCVLYEMLTGHRAFAGEDASDTLAAVLRAEPDWSKLPPDTPSSLSSLLQQCIARDRKARIADIAVADYVLRHTHETPLSRSRRRWVASAVVGSIALLAVMGVVAFRVLRSESQAQPARFVIEGTGTRGIELAGPSRDLVLTPDGSHIIYKSTNADGTFVLMRRALDQLDPTPLVSFAGTGFTDTIFVSPDSKWFGLGTAGELRKVPLTGGTATTICKAIAVRGATWSEDGTIVFATADLGSGLFSVSSAGGEPKQLTTPDAGRDEVDHVNPFFLPGQRAVLFTVDRGTGRSDRIDLLDLDTGARTPVIDGGADATYLGGGFLVYSANGGLNAVPFDARRREVRGEPIRIVEQVVNKPGLSLADYSVAANGTLVYVPGTAAGAPGNPRSLVWVDRQGREQAINAPIRAYAYGRLSPDGKRVAVAMRDQDADLWVLDLARGTLTRLTTSPALDTSPVWLPDTNLIVYGSQQAGVANLFVVPADASQTPRQLATSRLPQIPTSVSPDGRFIAFWSVGETSGSTDIGLFQREKNTADIVLKDPFSEQNAEISPDGRWLAYQSNESGQFEIYVRSFPNVADGRWTISSGGGKMPGWSRDGRELFYFSADGTLMRAAVDATTQFTAAKSEKVLDAKYFTGGLGVASRTFDISADGRRFLMIKDEAPPERRASPIVVVLNWRKELESRLLQQ